MTPTSSPQGKVDRISPRQRKAEEARLRLRASPIPRYERKFVKELDTSTEVVVYAKLPRGFLIPTPVGDYNPDWAISFKGAESSTSTLSPKQKGQCPP